jgi:non-specific serine/threonine protein kinase
VAARHRDYYQSFLVHPDEIVWGAPDAAQLERLEAEQENLRDALAWSQANADPEAHLRLAAGLSWFWFVRGDYNEGRRWLENAMQRGAGASSEARAMASGGAGALAAQQGDYEGAEAQLELALALRRELGQEIEAAWVLLHLGRVALLQGKFDRTVAIYNESLAAFRRIEYQAGIASCLMYLGMGYFYQSEHQLAESVLAESLPLLRAVKDALDLSRALHGLGLVALDRGDPARAMDLLQESLQIARERRYRGQIAEVVEAIAFAASARSQAEPAARLLGAAESQRQAIGLLRPPGLRGDYERRLSALRLRLDEAAFSRAWADGRRMDEAESLALAEALA